MTRTTKHLGFRRTKKISTAIVTLLIAIALIIPIMDTRAYAENSFETVSVSNECVTTTEVISVDETIDGRSVLRVKQCYYYDYKANPDNYF